MSMIQKLSSFVGRLRSPGKAREGCVWKILEEDDLERQKTIRQVSIPVSSGASDFTS